MTEQELKRAIEKAEEEERVDLLLQLANLARSYDPKKAVALAEDALALSIECALPDKQIQSHICLCDAQFTGGDFNGWRRSITDARALLKQHPDDALDFHLEILETRQLYMEGTIDVALERFLILDSRLEPLELTSNDWLRNFIRVKVYLGHCWLKINNPVAALDCYYGLDEIVQANDPQGSNPALNWQKQEVGRAHMALGEYEQARIWFRKDLGDSVESGLPERSAVALLLIPESYIEEEHWPAALTALEEAKRVYEKHQHTNPFHWLYWHQFSAVALRHVGHLDDALTHIRLAIELRDQIKVLSSEELLLELGLIHLAKGNIEPALGFLEEVVELVEESGNKKILTKAHHGLSQIHRARQNYEAAIRHSTLARGLEREEWGHSTTMAVAAVERRHRHAQDLKDAEIQRLKNVELIQKNQELTDLNNYQDRLMEERREIMSMAVHDLRSPLANISLQAQEIARSIAPETNGGANIEKIQAIQSTARNMGELIDRLLSSDRLEAGDFELITKEIDVHNVVAEVVDHIGESANAKSIKVVKDISPRAIMLATDPIFLQQILVNLLSAVIKYSPSRVEVTISGQVNNQTAHIKIESQRQFVMMTNQEHIFKRYMQPNAKSTAGETSTALGLHVAQRLAQALNGQIRVQSASKNLGTVFEIALPLDTAVEVRHA